MENLNFEISKTNEAASITSIVEVSPNQTGLLIELRKDIDNVDDEKIKKEAGKYSQKKNGRIAFIAMNYNHPLGYLEAKDKEEFPENIKAKDKLNNLAHLARIGVKVEARRKGVAKSLLNKAQEWALKREKIGFWLDYRQDNITAAKFYKNSGFINIQEYEDKKGIKRFLAIKKFNS